MTKLDGIIQSDILIRTAVIQGLAELRAHPELLRYVFVSLAKDSLTAAKYGEQEISTAIDWFNKTPIAVSMAGQNESPKFPLVTIALQDSTETEATLGDVNYIPSEPTEAEWPVLAGPMNPTVYNAGSGLMRLPITALGDLTLRPGLLIVDKTGRTFPIIEVLDDNTVSIKAGTVSNFSGMTIKSDEPFLSTQLEALNFRETYSLGCHAAGKAHYLTYLHSIILFILLRYKEVLLEARGFERSQVSSKDVSREENEGEFIYTRFIMVTGTVRQSWPKLTSALYQKITGDNTSILQVEQPGTTGPGVNGEGEIATEADSWSADRDIEQ